LTGERSRASPQPCCGLVVAVTYNDLIAHVLECALRKMEVNGRRDTDQAS